MGQSFASWNINMQSIPDKVDFYNHLGRLQPAWLLGMNDLAELASLRRVLPYTNLIHRWKVTPPPGGIHPDDDDNPTAYTPEAWLERRNLNFAEVGLKPGDVWLYTNNESGHSDTVLRWLSRVIELAVSQGHKLVVYNGSVGTPGPDPLKEWLKPEAQELLYLCSEHSENVILGLHEYAAGIITSGFVGGLPAEIESVHPDYTDPQNWPGKAAASAMTMWHVGRYKFLNRAAKLFPTLRIGITEYAPSDRINSGGYDVWLNSLPVADGFKEIRGPMTARRWWSQVFPDLSAEEAVALQDAYAQEVIYADSNVEFMLRFTMSASFDWVEAGFGYGVGADGWSPEMYYRLIEDYTWTGVVKGRTWGVVPSPGEPTPPPIVIAPLPPPVFPVDFYERAVSATLRSATSDRLRIRLHPTTESAIVGYIPPQGVDGFLVPGADLDESEIVLDEIGGVSGMWLPVMTGEVQGWVFSGLLEVEVDHQLPVLDFDAVREMLDDVQAGVARLYEYFDKLSAD